MSDINSSPALKRSFGMREAVTITAGSVIGVGLFTVGSSIVGLMGPSVIFATIVALLISVYPALLYAEMGAALPYAGGTYQFASVGIGRAAGVLAGWNFIISLVAVTGGEALAFSYYFKTLFSAFGVTLPFSDVAIAVVVTAGFIIANVCGVKIAGRLQNGFMFFFWGVAVIWFLTMIPNINLPSFIQAPSFLPKEGQMSFAASVCMIWWCFAGFEACVAMGEEIKYPRINIPRALFLAPFVVFAVNALFQWFLIAITPVESLASLASAQAPYADAMKAAGILGLPLALLAAGVAFGGDFSTYECCHRHYPSLSLYNGARRCNAERLCQDQSLSDAACSHHHFGRSHNGVDCHRFAHLHCLAVALCRPALLRHRHPGRLGSAPSLPGSATSL